MSTNQERKEAIRQFVNRWLKKGGKENQDDQSFWLELLHDCFGVEKPTLLTQFQKTVIVEGNTKFIDVYLPETRVLIEQKSAGIALDKKISNSGGIDLTPYEQAKRYKDNLPADEVPRWIVCCNFQEFWIYNMNEAVPKPLKLALSELPGKVVQLGFLVRQSVKEIPTEVRISLKAGEMVGAIYDALLKQYPNQKSPAVLKSLNKLCVRLVFCLYAEDSGIFGEGTLFHDYLIRFDAQGTRKALKELFAVLNQKPEERDPFLRDDDPLLVAFPYVNGGLFADDDPLIPPFTEHIRTLLLKRADQEFNWSTISPTIFGAVFESTLNPETRRFGGMHYTSIENIHKCIDPLFLEGLTAELEGIIALPGNRKKKLEAFQEKLSALKFLDPACGSGNFLTETYLCLRRLENRCILEMFDQQGQFDTQYNPIRVSIAQFYGIEINDFAVSVAQTALWIAESQMLQETEALIHGSLNFLPLKNHPNIAEGNALRMDWESVVPKKELNYIMGNPPFVGYAYQTAEQKRDMSQIEGLSKNADFVSAWFYKAVDYIQKTGIRCAFVSTNSITQGEQVCSVWDYLFKKYQLHLDFAYRTFRWDSEASIKAHVHCVIIGFSQKEDPAPKYLYDENGVHEVEKINPYLVEGENVFIYRSSKNLFGMPEMRRGSQPTDDGNLIMTETEMREAVSKEPQIQKYIRPFLMGKDFILRRPRYCLWLVGANPAELKKSKIIMERVEKVRNFRLQSSKAATVKKAETPTLFDEIVECCSDYVAIPVVSSENRRYIPIDYLSKNIIPGNKLFVIERATLYHFGVLTSNVHMAWTRAVCGRLKSDYSYSNTIVYNNFPWLRVSCAEREHIEKTARGILDARALYPESSLADLYDPLTMPKELRAAHSANDRAVMEAYGFSVKNFSESDCVAALMKRYAELTA